MTKSHVSQDRHGAELLTVTVRKNSGTGKQLFKEPVIRRFIGYENVVRVALGHAGIGDPYEFCLCVHIGDCL